MAAGEEAMSEQAFLMVVCVNDEALFAQCRQHLNALLVPPGFTLQILSIKHARSMTSAYNQALTHPAKYKIYLHQDTFILNHGFLYLLLDLFASDPRLGLVGLAGCKSLPAGGIWWESPELVGQVIEYRRQSFRLLQFPHGCEAAGADKLIPVQAVDGLLMATQYDVRWRDDLFDGFHFYDTSQCLEFAKAGYRIGIPVQPAPNCIHYCGDDFNAAAYEASRIIFEREYLSAAPG